MNQVFPDLRLVRGEAQFGVTAHDNFRIEDPHHQLFSERRWQCREPDLDLAARIRPGRDLGLDATVLRPALFDDVHAAQQLDAAGHRSHHPAGHLVDLVQHTVNAEARDAELAPRLEVDVARPLVECILQQPIDDVDDVRVVGLDLAAELDQLLEARHQWRRSGLGSAPDLLRQLVELGRIACDVERIRNDALDLLLRDLLDLAFPSGLERLAGGDRHLVAAHSHRQDRVGRGIRRRHHVDDAGEVDAQRIDVEVRQRRLLRQPLRQRLEVEQLALGIRRPVVHFREIHQRVTRTVAPAGDLEALGIAGRQHAIGDQLLEHIAAGDAAAWHRRGRMPVLGRRSGDRLQGRGTVLGIHASCLIRRGSRCRLRRLVALGQIGRAVRRAFEVGDDRIDGALGQRHALERFDVLAREI